MLCSRILTNPSSLHFSKASCVSFLISSVTLLKSLLPLNLGPKVGRFGKASNFMYLAVWISFLTSATLIYYSMYDKNGAKLSKKAWDLLTIVRLMIGCLREIFLLSRSFLEVSMMLMTSFIFSVMASLSNFSLTSEIITWWIDSWLSLLSFLMTSLIFWYMLSVKNGTMGLIKMLTFIKTSNKTFKLTFQLRSSDSPFSLSLFNLTYQLVKYSKKVIKAGTTL